MAESPPEVLDCATEAAATNSLLGLRIGAIFAILAVSKSGWLATFCTLLCAHTVRLLREDTTGRLSPALTATRCWLQCGSELAAAVCNSGQELAKPFLHCSRNSWGCGSHHWLRACAGRCRPNSFRFLPGPVLRVPLGEILCAECYFFCFTT